MRIRWIQRIFIGFAVIVAGRAALLQIVKDPRLERLANRQFNSRITTLPRRGLIFDRNGEGLAMTMKSHSLFFRPAEIAKELSQKKRTNIAFEIAKILKVPAREILNKMQSEKGFVWVKRQLTAHEEQAIRDAGLLEYGDAFGLAEETKRFYPNKELAAHVLGSVGVDGNGLEGLELFYDSILSGEGSKIASNKDAMGRRIFNDGTSLLALKDGQSLVLTLDKAIQYEAEKHLAQAVSEYRAKAGSVIVAEVASGEIRAMANYPNFDPNNPKESVADHRRNRAITDTYEPGSTFKPFVIAGQLEKGRSPKTQVYCEKGIFRVGDRKVSEAEAHEKFEWLTYGEILKFSSNIGAAKLALDLGPNAMAQLMARMGVGTKTDIDLPGEVSGSLNTKELHSQVRLANVGFGHGFTVTPLQMLSYYLAIANGGKWIQPKIVKAILSEDPDSLEKGSIRYKLGHRFDSLKSRKILAPNIATNLATMLETVTQDKGTATQAQLEEWPVAGKTGTAQKIDPETKKYSRTKHIPTFVGFAPAKSPHLVVLVFLDEPQKKFYAGETAAPTFREIMRASLLRERIPAIDAKQRVLQIANQNTIHRLVKGTSSAIKKTSQESLTENHELEFDNEANLFRLPNLQNKSIREIAKILGAKGIDYEINGSGLLVEQSPRPGEWVSMGTKVRLSFQ